MFRSLRCSVPAATLRVATLFAVLVASPLHAAEDGKAAEADAAAETSTAAEASPAAAGGFAAEDVTAGARVLARAFRSAARAATPAVVTIVAFGQADPDESAAEPGGLSPLFPRKDSAPENADAQLPATGLGSGVIIDSAGIVLTNHHVVRNASRIVVKLHDGSELVAREIVGDSDSDIATLKIDSPSPLVAATLGDSEAMEIGDWVLAIGSPFQLEATVSAGIISAKGRTIPGIRRAELLQTDAVINPGNSGGPLINIDGQVIGISTAIATRNGSFQGIGFAIPVDQARWIADELLAHGKVRRAKMGISLVELTQAFSQRLDVPPFEGVVAYQVTRDSAADEAGIEPLDVITEFAGSRVRRPAELRRLIERKAIGSTQPLRVIRDGETLELQVTLRPVE
ncbi:S1C family serine protease [Candidatus Laterigemmans baculatus]|uniref:S1C family serine protease n=1 Tax=Candidatus Laterigemmans baculatus TaxID=2770505 RepID=UPI0013DB4167|nr:trypsin-like peptidase domain-containing protein [Candidatus Laterigemmans baculatus]